MNINNIHKWGLTIEEAKKLQIKLNSRVSQERNFKKISLVAGADCGLNLKTNTIHSAVVVFSFPELEIVEVKYAEMALTFPYIPGFLSFRECPVLIETFKKIKNIPDVVFVDGHGISHPRGLGIASHLGLWLDISIIGCAKTVLVGKYKTFEQTQGSFTYLKHNGKVIAAALRTKNNCKPIFISVGHKINLYYSLKLALLCCDGYRILKPTRIADKLVRKVAKI